MTPGTSNPASHYTLPSTITSGYLSVAWTLSAESGLPSAPILDGTSGLGDIVVEAATPLTITGITFENFQGLAINVNGGNLTLSHDSFTQFGSATAPATTAVSMQGASPALTVNDSTFTNLMTGAGAIWDRTPSATPQLSVINSTFTGNTSTYSNYGAAISDFGGTLTVAGSTFANNVATGVDSSGALAVGRFGQAATTATISSSTFTGNSGTAAGAIGTSSLATGTGVTSLTAQTSTFSGNTASAGAGAIEIDGTSPVTGTVVSSTFSGNTAPAATGTAINAATAAATIGVADNLINGTCSGVSTFTDYGFNAAIDASCFEAAGPTDAVSANLGSSLGSLRNNGGATQTIQPGGVALNLIPAGTSQTINGVTGVGCPTTDQTGYTVAANTPCNAGSLQQQPPTFASPASGTLAIGTVGSVSIVSVGSPAATLTEAGALPSGVTFHPGTAGTATLSGTPAAGTGGTYSIVVTAANGLGAAQQAFSLTVTPVTAMFGGATTISGTPALNATLTCVGAPVSGSLITETYSWHVGTTAHNGSNQLKDVAADVGKQITCTVTASNAGGKVSSTSAAVIG